MGSFNCLRCWGTKKKQNRSNGTLREKKATLDGSGKCNVSNVNGNTSDIHISHIFRPNEKRTKIKCFWEPKILAVFLIFTLINLKSTVALLHNSFSSSFSPLSFVFSFFLDEKNHHHYSTRKYRRKKKCMNKRETTKRCGTFQHKSDRFCS